MYVYVTSQIFRFFFFFLLAQSTLPLCVSFFRAPPAISTKLAAGRQPPPFHCGFRPAFATCSCHLVGPALQDLAHHSRFPYARRVCCSLFTRRQLVVGRSKLHRPSSESCHLIFGGFRRILGFVSFLWKFWEVGSGFEISHTLDLYSRILCELIVDSCLDVTPR